MKKMLIVLLGFITVFSACSDTLSTDDIYTHIDDEIAAITEAGEFSVQPTEYEAIHFDGIDTSTFKAGKWYMLNNGDILNMETLHIVELKDNNLTGEYVKFFEIAGSDKICTIDNVVLSATGDTAVKVIEPLCLKK